MSDRSRARDPWTSGVESWLAGMDASRKALEELGQQLGAGGLRAASATAEDLGRVVQALSLLERSAEQGRAQQESLAQELSDARARIVALEEQLAALTGAVAALVERVVAAPKGP